MASSHVVTWISTDERGFEHLRLTEDSSGFRARGLIVRAGEAEPWLRYHIAGDARWRTREVAVEPLDGGAGALALSSAGEGRWQDERGRALDFLDGCVDVDIQASPFTNTITIRRLGLARGQTATTPVVFITVPDLGTTRLVQKYSRGTERDEPTRYRYQNEASGFHASLPVDRAGLLLEYPAFFRRAGS